MLLMPTNLQWKLKNINENNYWRPRSFKVRLGGHNELDMAVLTLTNIVPNQTFNKEMVVKDVELLINSKKESHLCALGVAMAHCLSGCKEGPLTHKLTWLNDLVSRGPPEGEE
ncbi:hypothetical protein AMTR_s00269p00014820, partial [Amborella trichopoda]